MIVWRLASGRYPPLEGEGSDFDKEMPRVMA